MILLFTTVTRTTCVIKLKMLSREKFEDSQSEHTSPYLNAVSTLNSQYVQPIEGDVILPRP